MTDLRQVEYVKSQLETAIDYLQEIADSNEYQSLKPLVLAKTGGLELEDILMQVNRFSKGVDDLDAIALEGTDTDADETERQESLKYWEGNNSVVADSVAINNDV